MSILKESAGLSDKSLESFIYDCCGSIESVNLYLLKDHPNIKTISQQAYQTWEVFCKGSYHEYIKGGVKLPLEPKQVEQLRKLTILSQFEGRQEIKLNELEEACELPRLEVLKLLVEMNTANQIVVKINEIAGVCKILSAKYFSTKDGDAIVSEAIQKLTQIEEKNKAIEKGLKNITPPAKKKYSIYDD